MVPKGENTISSLWIQLSNSLCVYVTGQRIAQRPQDGVRSTHSITAIQLFGVVMRHEFSPGPASRQLSLSQFIFSRRMLAGWGTREQKPWRTLPGVGGQSRGCQNTSPGEKRTVQWGVPNLWMSWKITRGPRKWDTYHKEGVSDQPLLAVGRQP